MAYLFIPIVPEVKLMHLLFSVLFVLLLAMPAIAEPLRPFVGAGGNLNQTNDHFMRCEGSRFRTVCRKLPDHSGLSLQFEGGVTNSTYSAYVGYRSGNSSLSGDDSFDLFGGELHIDYSKSEITSEHFVVGGRVQPQIDRLPEWLRPVLGVGLTWGHATKTTEWRLWDDFGFDESYQEELKSEDHYGGIVEIGAAFRPAKLPLHAFVLFEVHAYDARFNDQQKLGEFTLSPTADMYEIRENGIKAGVVYHFKKLGGE